MRIKDQDDELANSLKWSRSIMNHAKQIPKHANLLSIHPNLCLIESKSGFIPRSPGLLVGSILSFSIV